MSFWAVSRGLTPPSKVVPMLNPNQRQFLEDEVRYREKLKLMARGDAMEEVYVRKPETVDDPLELDKHDSFYQTTKSLLVLFQIMGVMPIHRNPPEKNLPRTGYSWGSKQVMWAVFIYSCQTTIVVLVLRERVKKFITSPDKRFDEAIYNVIFISLLFTNFLLPVASWRHGHQVAIFKNMWTNYQYKFFKTTGSPIVFPNLYPLTWSLCVFSWLLSIAINLSQYFLQPDFRLWYTFAYYPIIAMLNCFCSLWYINCNAFGTASRALSDALQHPDHHSGREARPETDRVPPSVGGPESHDAAAGTSVLQYVRHVLSSHLLHNDHRHLRQHQRNHRPRSNLQGGGPVRHCVLLHGPAVHHLQRGALRLPKGRT
ncbi:gustatory and odorant receptor 21a isoform X2 [Drosophila erecta]|uniref:gustatory and odorant receptor 21a isoform X2 n=1 Tax=Drosophila erecta TaxID=7220 RepID=UPI000F057AE4|nr:gustatory and odorant receptor 21a isoform X2 [Drosophila erecta]